MAKNKIIFNPLSGSFDTITDVSDIENRDKILQLHAYEDNQLVWGSAQPPMQDPLVNALGQKLQRDGWYFKNQTGQHISWYFFDGSTQATIQKANFSAYAVITLDVLTSKPIFGIYSFPTGSGDIIPGFAHSRWSYQISTANLATMTAGKKYLLYVGEDPSAHPEVPHIPLTFVPFASGGDLLDTEVIFTAALNSETTEPANEVQWMVESLGVWSPNYKHEISLRFKSVYAEDFADSQELVKEPTGFATRSTSTISFNEASRQFTIAPTGASFDVYVKGKKFTKTSESITLPNSTGDHYIYYTSLGVLSSTMVVNESLFADNALVSVIYWNADTSKQSYFGEERHGLVMDGATHGYLHTVFGARYISGCALQGFTIGSGSSNADAQFSADSGSIRDEDILHQLNSQAQLPVLYRSGSAWRKKPADAFPFIQSGVEGYTGASGRIAYNEYTGSAWQLSEVPNNNFVMIHVFATNDINTPYVAILGTNTYSTKPDAQDSANTEIASLSGIPFAEFVAIGTIILQTADSFTNSVKAAVQVTGDGADYVDFRGAQIFAPSGQASNHSLLSNLDKDDHIQYHNDARGDARYYTKTQTDTAIGLVGLANVGTGEGVYKDKVGSTSNLKSLKAGTNITLTSSANEITIDASSAGGEVNTASNVGTGSGVFKQKAGVDLQFKSIKAGTNITLNSSADEITISASGGGGGSAITTTYPLLDSQTNTLLETLTDKSKTYDITYSIDRGILNTIINSFSNQFIHGPTTSGNPGIRAIVVQPDGKILVGGDFIDFKNQTGKSRLIRLNADGTEDTAFSSNAVVNNTTTTAKFSAQINTIALQSDGKILVGGTFTNYSSQTGKSRLIRLNANGTEDTDFSSNAVVSGTTTAKFNNEVSSIAVQSDGSIFVGGNFTTYNGTVGWHRLVKFNSSGVTDDTFAQNAVINGKINFQVNKICIQSDGKILLAGNFSNYNTQTGKNYLIRLNANGTEDTDFSLNAVTAKFNNVLWAMEIQSDGKILIGGYFTNYGGFTGTNSLIRLNSNGTLDTAFSANAVVVNGTTARFSDGILALFVQSDGKILVGGDFLDYNGVTAKSRLIRLNSDGTEDTVFNNSSILTGANTTYVGPPRVFAERGGNPLIGGAIHRLCLRNVIVELNTNGSVSSSFLPPKFTGSVLALKRQPDGKILVGGNFTYVGEFGKNRLIRLNADGTEDTVFTTNAIYNGTNIKFSAQINTIALQSDGKILVGGNFTDYNSQPGKNRLIRLNANGTEDTDFSSNAVVNNTTTTAKFNNNISYIEIQSDGKILVGGVFTDYNSQTGKNRLIRLNANGTEDTDFSLNAVVSGASAKFSSNINYIKSQLDGKILVGGNFADYNLQPGKNRLIRLNANGTEDTDFSLNAVVSGASAKFSGNVFVIEQQPDGKILIGGGFTNYNSPASGKNFFIRLNSDGTEDTAFSANAVVNGTTARFSTNVSAITLQSDGKILVGGSFSNYSSQTGKNRLIRLNADGTEDTCFSQEVVANGNIPRFNAAVNYILSFSSSTLIGGGFTSYSMDNYSYLINIDAKSRVQIGKIQAAPSGLGFIFNTPTVAGPEFSTGVTMNFNSNGSITYNSDAVLSCAGIKEIKIKKDPL